MNNTTREFYHLFLKIMSKWIKWVKVLLKSSLPLFVRMLNNSYFLDVLKLECSSTWGCSWLLIVCLFLWNLKMVCKSLYKYKSVDLKFLLARNWALLWEMFVHSLWLHAQGWSKQTVKVIFFHCHLFFYRLCMSYPLFTHLWTLSMAFGLLQVKTSFHTPIFNYILLLFPKVEWYQLFTINTVNILLKTFHFQRLIL